MSALSLEEVTISLAGKLLLRLDVAVQPGEVATVMGPSGIGKSTLLRFVAGALPPGFTATGRVTLRGERLDGLPPERRRVGIMFQDDLLFPHLSVGANLLFAMRPGGSRAQRRARAEEALREVGLGGFFDGDPATLSGGQRARVALMRILVSEPRALLLDEPFSKLDMALRAQIRSLVFAEARRRQLPAILVTHDPADAAAAGGPVIELSPPSQPEA